MHDSTLDLFEEKAQQEAELEAYRLCEQFADHHELPTDYVYMEFVDPAQSNLELVKNIFNNALYATEV